MRNSICGGYVCFKTLRQ